MLQMDQWLNFSTLRGKSLFPPKEWTLFGSPETMKAMPTLHQEQIIFLDGVSTRKVYTAFNKYDILCGDDGWGNQPFSAGCFHSVALHQILEPGQLKKWLYRRGLAFSTWVLILPVFSGIDDSVILTTWKMIVKYAPELFSHDNLVVIGESRCWCLYYHHDGLISFACKPISL